MTSFANSAIDCISYCVLQTDRQTDRDRQVHGKWRQSVSLTGLPRSCRPAWTRMMDFNQRRLKILMSRRTTFNSVCSNQSLQHSHIHTMFT